MLASGKQRGVSLIELMITIVIASILLALALPSFQTMMASTRTKAVAESFLSGLRMARSESIKRNAPMRFHLVSSLTSSCAYSTTSQFWVVTQTDQSSRGKPVGYCGASPFTPPDQPDPCSPEPTRPAGNPSSCADEPYIAFKSQGDAAPTIAVAADSSVITFGPLGQVLTNVLSGDPGTLAAIDITSSNAEAKAWRVVVRSGGAIKLCDPDLDPADVTKAMRC